MSHLRSWDRFGSQPPDLLLLILASWSSCPYMCILLSHVIRIGPVWLAEYDGRDNISSEARL